MFRRVFKNKIFPDLSDETLTEVPSPYDLCLEGQRLIQASNYVSSFMF